MTDLEERLRRDPEEWDELWLHMDRLEAADELKRLKAENAALKADNAWLQGMYDHLIDRRPHPPGGSYTSSLKPGVLKELWDKLKAKEAELVAIRAQVAALEARLSSSSDTTGPRAEH